MVHWPRITTQRLVLVAASPEIVSAELAGVGSLGAALGADVSPDWPPEHWDAGVLRWLLEAARRPDFNPAWPGFYVLLAGDPNPQLIGTAGFKTPPDDHGVVELGYGIVASRQRRGYATEMVQGMIRYAWMHPRAQRVDAETFPDHTASLGVMRKAGMAPLGPGLEAGTVRWGVARPK